MSGDAKAQLAREVIGPQGVCEEAKVTGTHKGKWLAHAPTGQRSDFRVVIFFPWDLEKKKFKGERVFVFL